MVSNLVILKLVATSLGPTGLGLLGNLMSLISMASIFAGGGIGNGITKYVAQYQLQPIRRVRFIGSAMTYGMAVSLLILVLTLVAAKPLATRIFGSPGEAWLMPWFGVAQLLCFIGTATIAVANGRQRTDLFAKISISAYLFAIPAAYLLIVNFGFAGAAIALLLTISCTAGPALYFIVKSSSFRVLRFKASNRDLLKLSRFSMMLLASAIFFPSAEIFIRNQIILQLGYEQAGIWQALNRLSGAYLGFFTIFLSTHYMPKLSAITLRHEILVEVRKYLLGIGLAFLGFSVILYLSRNWVIGLLFSSSFLAMSDLVQMQLLGDFFRLMSYVIGFLGVAKAAVRLYILSELLQTGLYTFFSWFALQHGGNLYDIVYGYLWTYMLYFSATAVCLFVYARTRQ